jgi:toxin-antitoxin system PIN domain toxin
LSGHLPDTSVWLALLLPDHVHNLPARNWFDRVEEAESVVFCRATQQSLLRLLTTPAVFAPYGNSPLTNGEAWTVVDALMDDGRLAFRPDEPEGLGRIWQEFAVRPTASPKLWMDAYLAAFARASQMQLVTADSAFRQFEGLDLHLLS